MKKAPIALLSFRSHMSCLGQARPYMAHRLDISHPKCRGNIFSYSPFKSLKNHSFLEKYLLRLLKLIVHVCIVMN